MALRPSESVLASVDTSPSAACVRKNLAKRTSKHYVLFSSKTRNARAPGHIIRLSNDGSVLFDQAGERRVLKGVDDVGQNEGLPSLKIPF